MDRKVEGGLQSVASALDLLDCFVGHEELGVTEAAHELGVAKSTAHRLLTTLASRGVIEQNPATGKYRLGLHLFELGHIALSRIELRSRSKVLLEELREVSGWMVHLSIAQGGDMLILERLPTLRSMEVMQEYRRRWPLHSTASGLAICAFDPVAASTRVEAGFPKLTSRTIGSAEEFAARLAQVRRQGFATSNGELMTGLGAVAAPVLDARGRAIAAVSVTGSAASLEQGSDRLTRMVMISARKLGAVMAHREPPVVRPRG